jgi:anti-sigma-K factor RskA
LWVIDPKIAQPVSAGILAVPNDGLIRASFHPVSPIESAAAFAISVEKAGGASKPEGQIILVGK